MISSVLKAEPLHVIINGNHQFNESIGSVNLQASTTNYTEITIDPISAQNTDLSTVLEKSVGLQIQKSGGLGSFSTASLRAANSEQVLVFLDGILLNDSVSGYVDLSLIPINQIQRIEVFRGSTPIELGSASIGGAINLITRDSADSTKTIGVSAASYGASQFNLNWFNSTENNQYRFVAQLINNQNKYPIINDNGTELITSDDRIEDRNNAQTSQKSLLFTHKNLISDNRTWINSFRFFDKNQHLPNFNNSPNVNTSLDTSLFQLNSKLSLSQFFSKKNEMSTEVYLRKKEELYDDRESSIGLNNNYLLQTSQVVGIKLFNNFTDSNQNVWNFTFNSNKQNSLSEDLLDTLSDVRHKRTSTSLNIGLRIYFDNKKQLLNIINASEFINDDLDDAYDIYDNPVAAQQRNYTFNDTRIGYLLNLNDITNIKINIGQYHRVPHLYELYGDRGFFHGNSDLVAEYSNNLDMGIDTTFESEGSFFHQLRFYVGFFKNLNTDLIVKTYNSRGVGVSHNINDATIQGVESDISLPIRKNHLIKLNLAITDSEITSESSSFNGNIIPGQFTESYSLSYNYSKYAWYALLEFASKKGMFYDRSNLLRAKDRELIDATLRYGQQGHQFEASIKNILDKKYEDFNGYPKPGRIIYLAYSYNF